jgi:hypothetical protein
MQQRHHPGTDEIRVEPVLRAGGIAEHAVDARAELEEPFELRRSLQVFALREGARLFRDDVGLDALELGDEIIHSDHQVALDRKVRQRLDAQRAGIIVAQERLAPQFGDAVDHLAAAAADGHPARPAETECAVEVILDVLQPLQHRHVIGERHLIRLEEWLVVLLGAVAQDFDLDDLPVVSHYPPLRFLAPARPSRPRRHTRVCQAGNG